MSEVVDCLVIGAGPAGLTAGIYLGRFRRSVTIVDGGPGRTSWIARSHNLPGFPQGVGGDALLDRMRDQAQHYGAVIRKGRVQRLTLDGDQTFSAQMDGETLKARTVLLATGVVENEPDLPDVPDAVRRGLIRICPICDGYESIGRRIAVLGDSEHAAGEALFLRTYTTDVALILVGDGPPLPDEKRAVLDQAGVIVRRAQIDGVKLQEGRITALCSGDDAVQTFEVIYSAFGVTPQSALARSLGARIDDSGRLYADEHQQTSVPGLYAAGDLVRGLNQISVANGEAAIAATAVHNRLSRNSC